MSLAICGAGAFYMDAIEGSGDCEICGREDIAQKHGWVGTLCTTCGNDWSYDYPQGIVRRRREYLGFTRSEMARQAGLARGTIKYYEANWPSKRYLDLTLRMVRQALVGTNGD